MTAQDVLLRAALLSHLGSASPGVATHLSGLLGPAAGRSCLDGGSPLQLTVDAPGGADLQVGVRTDGHLRHEPLAELVGAPTARRLAAQASRTPTADHATFGSWVFWGADEASVGSRRACLYVDLRDPDPDGALARLTTLLGDPWRRHLATVRPPGELARPWAVKMSVDPTGITGVDVLWLLRRGSSVPATMERLAPGVWPTARAVMARLLRAPEESGRIVVTTPLDGDDSLRIGSTGWSLVPDDDRKRRALGRLVDELGGRRDHAEALWSLCRAGAPERWRVGRAVEVQVTHGVVSSRLFLTPWVEASSPITPGEDP